MYSNSVLNNAIIYCFFELHVTAPWPIWNKYPDIECQWGCPAQSTLQYPRTIDLAVHLPLKVSHNTHVVPRYTMTLFTASQRAHMGFWTNCARVNTAKAQSGLKIMTATGHFQLPQHMVCHTFSLAALGSTGIVCSKILCQDPWVLKQVLQTLV